MKNRLCALGLTSVLCLLVLGGCTRSSNDTNTNGEDQDSETATSGNSETGWTSVQAAEQAYAMITAEWKSNAVLWYMSPTSTKFAEDWQTSDKALGWTIGFVNPDNTDERLVYLGGPLNDRIDDVGNKRDQPIKSSYPTDKPKYSMKQAYQTALDNGGPTDAVPSMVYYDVDSLSYPGQPVWSFVFKFDTTAGEELHFYFVDGLTNELIQAAYKRDGDVIDKSETKAVY